MSIVHIPDRTTWTVVDNRAINDDRLSFKALGLLTYLLSKPAGWEVNHRHLAATHTDGAASVLSALKELEEAGYIRRGWEYEKETGRPRKTTTVYEWPEVAVSEASISEASETEALVSKEVVSTEVVSTRVDGTETDDTPQKDPNEAEKGRGSDYRFQEAWERYPERAGRKVGKKQAREQWMRLSYDEKGRCWRAIRAFAADRPEFPPDMHRWLRNRTWEDYLAPATGPTGSAAAGQVAQRKAWADMSEEEFRGIWPSLSDMERTEAIDARRRAEIVRRLQPGT